MTENIEKNLEKTSASPKARKFARELGVDINEVTGSERIGRVIEKDIKYFVSSKINNSNEFNVRRLDVISSDEKVALLYIFNLNPTGFVIVSAEDTQVNTAMDIRQVILENDLRSGDELKLKIYRDEEYFIAKLKLGSNN